MTDSASFLRVAGVGKSYGGLQALQDVSFDVERGEVHAIVGENGAGKSTLMRILAGVEPADAGVIEMEGRPVLHAGAAAARASGIAIIFQELNLFPHLSVTANIFAGRERTWGRCLLDEASMRKECSEALAALGVAIDPTRRVRSLSTGERQLVEIARAVSSGPRLLILDEPNSALNEGESRHLFDVLRRLSAAGVTSLYISHRLEEVFAIADRISVLRDGQYRGTWRTADTSVPEIVRAMTGRGLDEGFPVRGRVAEGAPVLLEAADLACAPRLERLSLRVREGEIVGLAGIEGAGVEEVFRALFGLERPTGGKVTCPGGESAPATPAAAMRLGVGLIPRSRREEGLFLAWPVRKNATVLVLRELAIRWGILSPRRERRRTDELLERLRVVTDSREKRIGLLSGGNQQKVVFAKWLATRPRVLLLHDPTRGVDVGAKAEIYKLCCELAADGMGILFASSEVEETLGLCDRVVVLYRGKAVREFERDRATKQDVLEAMTSG